MNPLTHLPIKIIQTEHLPRSTQAQTASGGAAKKRACACHIWLAASESLACPSIPAWSQFFGSRHSMSTLDNAAARLPMCMNKTTILLHSNPLARMDACTHKSLIPEALPTTAVVVAASDSPYSSLIATTSNSLHAQSDQCSFHASDFVCLCVQ